MAGRAGQQFLEEVNQAILLAGLIAVALALILGVVLARGDTLELDPREGTDLLAGGRSALAAEQRAALERLERLPIEGVECIGSVQREQRHRSTAFGEYEISQGMFTPRRDRRCDTGSQQRCG